MTIISAFLTTTWEYSDGRPVSLNYQQAKDNLKHFGLNKSHSITLTKIASAYLTALS